jgi:hypothetical protein
MSKDYNNNNNNTNDSIGSSLDSIPFELRELVNKELENGEEIEWIDQPIFFFFSKGFLILFFGILVWAVFMLWMLNGGLVYPFIVSVMVSSIVLQIVERRRLQQTVYVITNQRVIIFIGSLIKKYKANEIEVLNTTQNKNGIGNIFSKMIMFENIRNVEKVEQKLLKFKDTAKKEDEYSDKQDKMLNYYNGNNTNDTIGLSLDSIPLKSRELIDDELEAGENIEWVDQPVPYFFLIGTFVQLCCGIFLLYFGVLMKDSFLFFSLLFWGISFYMILTPVLNPRRLLRTVYVITNRRVIIFNGKNIEICSANGIVAVRRTQNRNGIGTIFFDIFMFENIRNAKEVEQKLLRLKSTAKQNENSEEHDK